MPVDPVVAQGHKRVYGLWIRSPLEKIKPWVSRHSAAINPAIQRVMSLEFGGKWGTECLNTRLAPNTLLCAGYSVKLI